MEKNMETTILGYIGLGSRVLGGNQGMEIKVETAILGYIGTAIRIHFFIPS